MACPIAYRTKAHLALTMTETAELALGALRASSTMPQKPEPRRIALSDLSPLGISFSTAACPRFRRCRAPAPADGGCGFAEGWADAIDAEPCRSADHAKTLVAGLTAASVKMPQRAGRWFGVVIHGRKRLSFALAETMPRPPSFRRFTKKQLCQTQWPSRFAAGRSGAGRLSRLAEGPFDAAPQMGRPPQTPRLSFRPAAPHSKPQRLAHSANGGQPGPGILNHFEMFMRGWATILRQLIQLCAGWREEGPKAPSVVALGRNACRPSGAAQDQTRARRAMAFVGCSLFEVHHVADDLKIHRCLPLPPACRATCGDVQRLAAGALTEEIISGGGVGVVHQANPPATRPEGKRDFGLHVSKFLLETGCVCARFV